MQCHTAVCVLTGIYCVRRALYRRENTLGNGRVSVRRKDLGDSYDRTCGKTQMIQHAQSEIIQKRKSLYCPINSTGEMLLYSIKCIAEGFDKVVNIFNSYRKSDSIGLDPLIEKLFFVELRMCCRSGVDNERLNICNICEQ